jgi:hypothetical protein
MGDLMLWDRGLSAQPGAYCTLDSMNVQVEEETAGVGGDDSFCASCDFPSSGGEGDECTIAWACTRFNITISIRT